MSRYRKIEVRTWSDEKFRELSPIPPSGQGLWFFLLTGPHTTAIPGLFRAGRAAMAEELNWDQKDFDKAFQEVSWQGMAKADFKAKLVWLPKAIQHNKPESPNVVRGWRVELDLLPECDLKREAIAGIREALEGAGPSYVEAFDEVLTGKQKEPSKPSPKPSRKTMANQEQEQEQEQDQEPPPSPQGEGFDAFWQAYPKKVAKEAARKAFGKRKPGAALLAEMLAAIAVQSGSEQWRKDGGQFIPYPATWLNEARWEDVVPAIAAGSTPGPKRGSDEYAALHKSAGWWREAGFDSVWSAIAAKCWHDTAHQFRDGKRVEVAA